MEILFKLSIIYSRTLGIFGLISLGVITNKAKLNISVHKSKPFQEKSLTATSSFNNISYANLCIYLVSF